MEPNRKHLPYQFNIDLAGFKLPQEFLFGVCNSPFHSEGYYNMEGHPFNQWGKWEQAGIAEESGLANKFWDEYQPHIDKAQALGLNAFRMGFDWTRIQPSFSPEEGPEPAFDPTAFERYAEIVGAVYAAGMVPVITLYHFIQPAWVGPDLWIKPDMVEKFIVYAHTTVEQVNKRLVQNGHPPIWFWVTFNEPSVYPTHVYLSGQYPFNPQTTGMQNASTAQDNIIASHVRLYDLIHDLYQQQGWPSPHVGFNVVSSSIYEFDKGPYDLVCARELGVPRENLEGFLSEKRADFYSYYDRMADRRLGSDPEARRFYEDKKHEIQDSLYNPIHFTRAIEALYASDRPQKMDYVAINIYDPFLSGTRYEKPAGQEANIAEPAARPPWWEWNHERKTFEEHIELYARGTRERGLPFYILEASIGHKQPKFGPAEPRPDGLTRIQYLKETLGEVLRGIQKGYPIHGYLYWTLCDNYEWGTYTVRLGLLEYDFSTHTIKDTDAFGLPTGETYHYLIEAMRSGSPQTLHKAFETLDIVPAETSQKGG